MDDKPIDENPVKNEDDSNEESGEDDVDENQLNDQFLNFCRENNTEEALNMLNGRYKSKINVNHEKDNWNPLLWASCNGNIELVDRLIDNHAHNQYIKNRDTDAI